MENSKENNKFLRIEEENQSFLEICDEFSLGNQESLLVAYYGEFSQELVNSISEGLEDILFKSDVKKKIIKRMFSIIIEGLQNIRIHGSKKDIKTQPGHVVVGKMEDGFNISFGNFIKNKDIEKVTGYIDKLNGLDTAEVKELYLKSLENGLFSSKGGAGLGFITIAMKSKSRFDYNFDEVSDELSYFSVKLKLAFD